MCVLNISCACILKHSKTGLEWDGPVEINQKICFHEMLCWNFCLIACHDKIVFDFAFDKVLSRVELSWVFEEIRVLSLLKERRKVIWVRKLFYFNPNKPWSSNVILILFVTLILCLVGHSCWREVERKQEENEDGFFKLNYKQRLGKGQLWILDL